MSSVGVWKTNLARNGRLIYRLVGSIPTQPHITYIFCYKIVLMFYNDTQIYLGFLFNIYNKINTKMRGKRHIQSFNEHQENLNISDVSSSFPHTTGGFEQSFKYLIENGYTDEVMKKILHNGGSLIVQITDLANKVKK